MVLTDLPYIIKMWQLLNKLPEKGWHRPQLKIADRVAIITFAAEGELLPKLQEMVQQKQKLRTAYSSDQIRIGKRPNKRSSDDTGSFRDEPNPPPPQEEAETMDADVDMEVKLQPDNSNWILISMTMKSWNKANVT